MMWLGVVLHVSMNHVAGDFPIPWRDQQTSVGADLLLAFIHAFRMPVFFVVAGFFVALLVAQKGANDMLKHRMRRLALPFVVFWPIIFLLTIPLVAMFMHQITRGTIGLDLTLIPKPPSGAVLNTLHLWFLYILIWFCLMTAIVVSISNQYAVFVKTAFTKVITALISNAFGVFVLALPLAFAGSDFRAGILAETGSFLPPFGEWIQHGIFFVAGFALFSAKGTLLAQFASRCWLYISLGAVAFIVWLVLNDVSIKHPTTLSKPEFWMAYSYNLCTWLWTFAIIGLFTRYFDAQGPKMRYLAQSSYWVYLVHMLGTIGFGALICNLELPVFVKMLINITATTFVCLFSYHFFVRKTFIGQLFNAKKAD
jgi:glucans biosynthesis protein C